jgi:hypothetical protein
MKMTQISVKMPDRPGELSRISDILGNEGVNIRALAASVHGDDSRIHMLVDDSAKARDALSARGFEVEEHTVLAVETPDHPGGLSAILRPLRQASINVTHLYPLIGGMVDNNAVLILGVDRTDEAIEVLRRDYIRILELS